MDESEEEFDSDLETTMQKKYMEQSMQQQKLKRHLNEEEILLQITNKPVESYVLSGC